MAELEAKQRYNLSGGAPSFAGRRLMEKLRSDPATRQGPTYKSAATLYWRRSAFLPTVALIEAKIEGAL